MKKLEQSWIKKGFQWTVLHRIGNIAVVKQSLLEGNHSVYNVVIVQERAEHTWPNGVTSEAHEAIPSSEQWGVAGWTCQTIEEAKSRMVKLLRKADPKANDKFTISDIEVPVTSVASDPDEDISEPEPTVPVLRVTQKTSGEIVIPDGEFTTVQFSELNGLPPVGKGYITLKQLVEAGKVKEVARRKVSEGRGRATVFYGKA